MRMPSYEQALQKFGIPFEYVDAVPLADINVNRGKLMQARLDPIDQNLVGEYSRMLGEGFEPPPLLLWKHGRSLLVPLDGNQRLAANAECPIKARRKTFSAYIVKLDDQMVVDRLCWQFNNTVNGRRLSYDECMEHAITFVRKYNQPMAPTAKEWGVKGWELVAKVKELELRDFAAENKIDMSKIPNTTVLRMQSFEKLGEDVLGKVMKATANSGIGHDAVAELASDVEKAKTLPIKLRLIDEFVVGEKVARAAAVTKNGKIQVKRGRHPREQLHKLLEQLEKLFDDYKAPAFKPGSKDERERYSGSALFVTNNLITIYGLGSLK